MAWFKRKEKGITTATEDKKDLPKGFGTNRQQEKL
jgi:acetyl-CoA carboxylase carboxyl transferase subunit beta